MRHAPRRGEAGLERGGNGIRREKCAIGQSSARIAYPVDRWRGGTTGMA